jgi:hypothetical protein
MNQTAEAPVDTAEANELDDAMVDENSEEEMNEINEIINPTYASLKIDGDNEANKKLWTDLVFHALRQIRDRKLRIQCEACTLNHDKDECWTRGPEFQDIVTRRELNSATSSTETSP